MMVYILAQVVVPEQDIKDGTVQLHVVEGHIAGVSYKGQSRSQALVEKILNKVKNRRAFNISSLEQNILLLNDIPGVSAKTTLIPTKSTEPGAVDLLVEYDPETHISQSVTADNAGSRYIGPYEAGYRAVITNLLPNQQTSISANTSHPHR